MIIDVWIVSGFFLFVFLRKKSDQVVKSKQSEKANKASYFSIECGCEC